MQEGDTCRICKGDATVRVELTAYEGRKVQSKSKYCISCWNKYYRPGIAVVTELLEGRNET